VSLCNTVKDFFEEVQKAAKIGGQSEHQTVVMCKLTWLPEELEYAVMEGDEKDFEVLLDKMESSPADQEYIIEVRCLS